MTQSGFGNIDGEYWLGLESIYSLGRQSDYKLLIELEDWMGKKVYAQYGSFHLEPASQDYRLRLGTYQGNAGDSLSSHNGKQFTTLDRDKDAFSGRPTQALFVRRSALKCAVGFFLLLDLREIRCAGFLGDKPQFKQEIWANITAGGLEPETFQTQVSFLSH